MPSIIELSPSSAAKLTPLPAINFVMSLFCKAYLGAFEIAGGSYDYVSGKLDADKIQSAEEINLANAVVNGTIELVDRTGKTYEHLSYKLVAPALLPLLPKARPNQ